MAVATKLLIPVMVSEDGRIYAE